MKETMQADITSQLNKGTVRLMFTKLNGEIRIMTGTRDHSLIPVEDHPKGTGQPGPPGVVRVYDIENAGWRSFNIDTLISYEEVA